MTYEEALAALDQQDMEWEFGAPVPADLSIIPPSSTRPGDVLVATFFTEGVKPPPGWTLIRDGDGTTTMSHMVVSGDATFAFGTKHPYRVVGVRLG